jgi:hypothetical protein
MFLLFLNYNNYSTDPAIPTVSYDIMSHRVWVPGGNGRTG